MLTMRVLEDSCETGRLYLSSRVLSVVRRIGSPVIDISPHFAPERERVEDFIRTIYARSYNADITINYPMLMSVRTKAGEIRSAIGFRYAAEAPLFMEHYTGTPIEKSLSDLYKTDIPRTDIAEIGNLASGGGGASVYLFAALSSYLHARGIRYAVITGTDFLYKRLRRLGLEPQTVCKANPGLLPDHEQTLWGSYYDTNPQVLCGSVGEGVCHLKKALGMIYEERPGLSLFSRLHYPKIS